MNPDETELETRMARLRQQAGPVAFEAGFADRVMARLERQTSLTDGLRTAFVRLAPLAAAARSWYFLKKASAGAIILSDGTQVS